MIYLSRYNFPHFDMLACTIFNVILYVYVEFYVILGEILKLLTHSTKADSKI